jgi:hypothetical protein
MSERDKAERDLSWYFAEGEAAIGVRAMPLGVSGTTAYDEEASHAAHLRRRTPHHRAAVARKRFVEAISHAMPPGAWAVLVAAYTPFGACRVSHRGRTAFTIREGLYVLPVMLSLPALHRAFWRAHGVVVKEQPAPPFPAPPFPALLTWVEGLAAAFPKGELPTEHRLRPAFTEAVAMIDAAREAFAARHAEAVRAEAAAADADDRARRVRLGLEAA